MKNNIQDYPDAIKLVEYNIYVVNKASITRYIYCIPGKGMLYEVDATNGTITGEKYILDISFSKYPTQEKDDQDINYESKDSNGYY